MRILQSNQAKPTTTSSSHVGEPASISPAAQRALAEAEARRALELKQRPVEIDGRQGLDPVRYGDWEVKGLASDF
jgi:hypothetical protein